MDSNSSSTNPNQIYEFDGTITAEKFYSSESNWGCFLFKTETALPNTEASKNFLIPKEDRDKVKQYYYGTMTGKVQRLYPNTLYHFKAKKEFNKKYQSWQYSVISAETDTPKSVEDQKNFLLSICTEGQVNTLLEAYPDIVEGVVSGKYDTIDLEKTKGIKEFYWNLIKTRILENYVMADILAMLIPIGVSYAKVKKLLNDEPNPLVLKQKLLDDPYIIVDVPGISFTAADKIALKIKPDLVVSRSRVVAFIKNYLKEIGEEKGDTWITKDTLELAIKENIIECGDLFDSFISEEKDNEKILHIEEEKIGLKYYHTVEEKIWKKVLELNNSIPLPITQEQIDKGIEIAESELGFPFTDEQKETIIKMTRCSFGIITGFAGTGKTTITRGLLNIYKYAGYSIATCALSARASKRIQEVTHFESSTIHRLLASRGLGNFYYNEQNPLEYSVIMLDESSMVYAGLFYHLISAIKPGAKLILSGDNKQLPPLSWGQTFGDLLERKEIQVNYLTKILRQANDSGIISDSNKIREGVDPLDGQKHFKYVSGKLQDLYYMARDNKEELNKIAIKTYVQTVKDIGVDNVQIIVPRRKDCINSVREINKVIQDLLIDDTVPYIQYGDTKYKLGSRIMHIKNNYLKGVFNGDLGFLSRFDKNEEGQKVTVVQYPDFEIEYTNEELNEIEMAYAMSCHKMQGGQCHTIIGIIDNSHFMLLDRTLLYTLLTRSVSRCLLLFQPFAYDKALSYSKVENRQTWTKYF
jgi:exodeoxyribonuclease V alpha subunit